MDNELAIQEQNPDEPMPDGTLLKDTNRQRLRNEAKKNRKKLKTEMKTLARPLKVGEFMQYTRQQEGVLAFIHEFLKEVHPDEYTAFIKKIQEQEDAKKQPTEEQIQKAEIEEALESGE